MEDPAMARPIVRWICAALMLFAFTGCRSTGAGGPKKKTKPDPPGFDAGAPGMSPFTPFPKN
jgi:hypothetical protein